VSNACPHQAAIFLSGTILHSCISQAAALRLSLLLVWSLDVVFARKQKRFHCLCMPATCTSLPRLQSSGACCMSGAASYILLRISLLLLVWIFIWRGFCFGANCYYYVLDSLERVKKVILGPWADQLNYAANALVLQ
jgi:hypothetical protein